MLRIIIVIMFAFRPLTAAATGADNSASSEKAEFHFTHDGVNGAKLPDAANLDALSPEQTLKLQVLLDRAHFSPGEIDGQMGENTVKAFLAFKRENGLPPDEQVTTAAWQKLAEAGRSSGDATHSKPLAAIAAAKPDDASSKEEGPARTNASDASQDAVIQVPISEADLRGPFARHIPKALKAQARLRRLSYRNPDEELGERYHASPALLRALNPGGRFRQGQQIWVPNIHRSSAEGRLVRIVADKRFATVQASGESGRTLAIYPATIGSEEKPTPAGRTEVVRVARNPWYTYDPRLVHFKEVKTRTKFKIAPGPNNPVGLVWIELAKKGYGIHGTPDPGQVSKTSSHGCVRLTNWDALELAGLVERGIPVEFTDGPENPVKSQAGASQDDPQKNTP